MIMTRTHPLPAPTRPGCLAFYVFFVLDYSTFFLSETGYAFRSLSLPPHVSWIIAGIVFLAPFFLFVAFISWSWRDDWERGGGAERSLYGSWPHISSWGGGFEVECGEATLPRRRVRAVRACCWERSVAKKWTIGHEVGRVTAVCG